jgi:molybdopterin-guanine dinucleotide biosynthesis protein A
MTAADTITGLVLAGGLGSRMGGADKGLQLWRGAPLAQHTLARLQPQVGALAVSANRHFDAYCGFGVPVWPDAPEPQQAGPLAGLLAGLTQATTPLLAVVPCDVPNFPRDLVQRLADALAADPAGAVAYAVSAEDGRAHPTCCLLRTSLRDDLAAHLAGGGRKVLAWMQGRGGTEVPFGDAAAFANINTLADLGRADDGR